jgi:hypothetical protein
VSQLYPQALGSLFVASCDSQGYGGGIRPHLHTGLSLLELDGLLTTFRHEPHRVKVKVTLRLTVSQSVSRGVEPHLGLVTRYLLLFDSYGLAFVERPL